MNFKIGLGVLFWAMILLACQREDFSFNSSTKPLEFSKETLFCDTVYNQVRSETYVVKVYNKENKDIRIPKIFLEKNSASQYRINVDGKADYSFDNVPIRALDSLFIFVEIAPNINSTQAIAEDRIVFEKSPANQYVTLLSVVQDAEFFISTKDKPKIISTPTIWNNSKAKIIYGNVSFAEGSSLTVEKGTKVYFTKDSKLSFGKNTTFHVNGDLNEEVIFRGDRNDIRYDTIPKNWDGLYFDEGAKLNINFAKIYGGTTGLHLKKAIASIKNTIIHTFQDYGIYAVNAQLTAENLVMNNCGQSDIAIFKGGSYDLKHCSLANYWNLGSSPALAVYATNEWQNEKGIMEQASLQFNFQNSIAYTKVSNAFVFKPNSGQAFNYWIENSLLKYATGSGYNWDNNASIINSLQNQDPKFINYFTEKMNLRVADTSPAKGKGKLTVAQQVPLDIKKLNRTVSPTLGAYQ